MFAPFERFVVLVPLILGAIFSVAGFAQPRGFGVSAQGTILRGGPADAQFSPRRRSQLRREAIGGDFTRILWRVEITNAAGRVATIPSIAATSFLLSDVDRLVAIEAMHANTAPTRVTVLDLSGERRLEREVSALIDPQLSPDGAWLAYGTRDGVEVVDLERLTVAHFAPLRRFAVGPGGVLAGVEPGVEAGSPERLVLIDAAGGRVERPLMDGVRRVTFARDGSAALAMTSTHLWRLSWGPGVAHPVYTAPRGAELRDLLVAPSGVLLGERRRDDARIEGRLVTVGASSGGPVITIRATTFSVPNAPSPKELAWPLHPSAQHPIGNSYGEFQKYGNTAYLHPGIDVLGADLQPVHAVKGGVVKAVLTTSGQYHWRVAIADEPGSGESDGYLYAHLHLPTITVNVGDTVVKGEVIGDLVPWPVTGFTHTHFARVRDTGTQWSGSWLCTDNPHTDLENRTDATAPVFQDAVPSGRFAFCNDNTSVYRDPLALTGKVDIIARVGDTIASSWVCAAQRLRYRIYPVGNPAAPVVDDTLAVNFDMALDTYQGGPIDPFLVGLLYKTDSTCNSLGDYNNRRFFHVLTNTDGDETYDASDLAGAWDTTALSDGTYVVEVTAVDAAGNATVESMVVRTNNGNP